MQNYEKLKDLLDSDVCKAYVNKLLHQNPATIALQYRDKIPCDASVLANIIKLYQKALSKLPLWVENHCMLTTKSYEQATSQIVALYKSTFIRGKKLLVLGGGLGVDEWAFANSFNSVISIDTDSDLNKCVAYNHKKMQIDTVERITSTAQQYLNKSDRHFDCIYTDPDRRDERGQKQKTLQNASPNIIELLPSLLKKAPQLIIKASPLIDIQKTAKELGQVETVRVLAVANEVKEVLFFVSEGFEETTEIIADNYNVNLGWESVSSKKLEQEVSVNNEAESYFYEPNTAILKAGLADKYAENENLKKIGENTVYYTSDSFKQGYYGRVFKIVSQVEFSKKEVRQYLKRAGIVKANVAKRNFRLTVDEIRKAFTIKDGGEHYLFFTQRQGKPVMFHCLNAKHNGVESK